MKDNKNKPVTLSPAGIEIYDANYVHGLEDELARLRESHTCETCQNPISARTNAEIIDRLRAENERLREALTNIARGPVGYWNKPEVAPDVVKAYVSIATKALKPPEQP